MKRVLLLNQSFEPISIISWRKAICLLCLNKVETIKEYDFYINSPSVSIKAPSVVRLLSYFKRPWTEIKLTRGNIFARDGWKCVYCGKKFPEHQLTTDHIVPRCRGGKSTWENLVSCCQKCNGKKADKSLKEAGFKLLKTPKKPDVFTFFSKILLKGSAPKNWREYEKTY